MNHTSAALGKEIRYQRRLSGLTLKQVAARIGVTGVQLHRYEVGTTGVTTGRLVAIANALGIRPDVLLNAATASEQPPVAVNPASIATQDFAAFLEMFMTIKDPSHRDALMAVARMMSSSSGQQPAAQVSANGTRDPRDVFVALAA
ncbi:helix-turn-helix domain-containing protein [Roseomonas haemaphysalidis]|uniref:Helix-turn-helix transcriptional regulator n=1 Tax=Roseomonas haemaphysalidis TaxID=2768162 RepID=A0ABS3KSZ9_9PROT|nr:helix-turn-helix transcriptional regulator [Roseomonas haemaphysalidis]MBO1080162.1 helix-turn-helix transcriptional regulator [Roseomonas haemaphysalidis]